MALKKVDKIGVYPSSKFKKVIEAEAKKEGRSVSNYVVNILTKHINQKKKNKEVEKAKK